MAVPREREQREALRRAAFAGSKPILDFFSARGGTTEDMLSVLEDVVFDVVGFFERIDVIEGDVGPVIDRLAAQAKQRFAGLGAARRRRMH